MCPVLQKAKTQNIRVWSKESFTEGEGANQGESYSFLKSNLRNHRVRASLMPGERKMLTQAPSRIPLPTSMFTWKTEQEPVAWGPRDTAGWNKMELERPSVPVSHSTRTTSTSKPHQINPNHPLLPPCNLISLQFVAF